MLKMLLVIVLRRFSRERAYVAINIASLALGIASFLAMALYLRAELTYDRHHENYQQIYRLSIVSENAAGEAQHWALTGPGLGPLMTRDFPQLGTYVRFQSAWDIAMRVGDKRRVWDTVYFVDPAVYDVFTLVPVYGDPQDALKDASSVAISESFARFYFGERNPIGETIMAENGMPFEVAFVFEDFPDNTHLRYDLLAPFMLLDRIMPGFSDNYAATLAHTFLHTYVQVPGNFDPAAFEAMAGKFVDTHMKERASRENKHYRIVAQRLDRIHYGPRLQGDLPAGNILHIYAAAAIGGFILLVACINYVNLATARAMKRAREVGIRKLLGAGRSELIRQFLAESAALTAVALVAALIILYIVLTVTGGWMGRQALLGAFGAPSTWIGILALGTCVALAAGLYPAFRLASLPALAALTVTRQSWRTGGSLRHALVFMQLAISIGVIAATLAMLAQMRYVHDKPLGFDAKNRLILSVRGYDAVKQAAAIRAELRRQPGIADVTTISTVPGTGAWSRLTPVESNASIMEPVAAHRLEVGANFPQVMDLQIVAGRGFSEDMPSDLREAVLVNEALVKRMGWEEPLGKRVEIDNFGTPGTARVVGVVRDFHYASLHDAVGPLIVRLTADVPPPPAPSDEGVYERSFVAVLAGAPPQSTFDDIERAIRKFDPRFNFEPVFLEDRIGGQYRTESNLMKLTGLFAAICILISIMGIFGLASFTTEQRTKEIGIRKVLGASDGQIVRLLGMPLAWLVLAASIPASVLCYQAIESWLQRFAYRTEVGLLIFVTATASIGAIALATTALQSLRAARHSPIDAIRHE